MTLRAVLGSLSAVSDRDRLLADWIVLINASTDADLQWRSVLRVVAVACLLRSSAAAEALDYIAAGFAGRGGLWQANELQLFGAAIRELAEEPAPPPRRVGFHT